jgi:hypothetical protein
MLDHVVETQMLNHIFGGVDLLVRVLELGFNHKRRGIAVSAGRGVVGAGVAAFGLDIGDVAVLYKSVRNK